MLRFLLLGALCLLWASIATAQTDAYYWAEGDRIALTASETDFILIADDAATLTGLQPGGLESYRSWPHKPYAVMETSGPRDATKLTADLGLGASTIQVSPGYTLADGYTLYPTRKVVAQLEDGVSRQAMLDVVAPYGVLEVTEQYGTYRIKLSDAGKTIVAANRLQESGLCRFAQPDFYAPIERYQVSDPLFSEQFQMHNTGQTIDGVTGADDADCNALEAWGITLGSANTTVAVIDDGLENHEDFNNAAGQSRYTAGFSPANNGNGNAGFGSNHGVSCAGTIAASHNDIGVRGLAPLTNMISVNIFAGGESTQDIADGFTWAKNQGADVISNSWGFNSCEASFSNISSAIADANANGRGGLGCVIVFASGNGSKDCVDYPARNQYVIAVGAFNNTGSRSSYSNYGPALDIVAPSDDRGALGAGVRTTDRMGSPGYEPGNYTGRFGGTSSACPVVAGVATLLLGRVPELSSTQVKRILYATATDMGPAGEDLEYGSGRVNALAALRSADNGGGGEPDPEPESVSPPTNFRVSDAQQTQISLAWDAPETGVVTGYEIFFNGTPVGVARGTVATITRLDGCSTYEFGIRTIGEAGAASDVITLMGTTAGCGDGGGDDGDDGDGGNGGGTPFSEAYFFESGYQGWVCGGSDCRRRNTVFSWEGNYSIRLRDDTGVASSMFSPPFDLAGLNSVAFRFNFYPNSMEAGEEFLVRYYDNSGWQTVATYVSGVDFENGEFYVATVNLSSSEYNLTDGASFRIECNASGNRDWVFIDEVTVVGSRTATASNGAVATIEVLDRPRQSDTQPVVGADVLLFPNPASETITVQAAEAIDLVTVFNLRGQEVLRQRFTETDRVTLDVSTLAPGVYFISSQTGKERYTKRLLIQR